MSSLLGPQQYLMSKLSYLWQQWYKGSERWNDRCKRRL